MSDIATIRTALQSEMERLQNRLKELAIQSNAVTPINSLPPEILSAIFCNHRQLMLWDLLTSTEAIWSKRTKRPASLIQPECFVPWVAPSQTCSRWRTVALDTASLWSTIFLNSVDWTAEFLRRSKGSPLAVQITPPHLSPTTRMRPEAILKCLRLVVDTAGDRISHLDLKLMGALTSDHTRSLLGPLLQASRFPSVRALSISCMPPRLSAFNVTGPVTSAPNASTTFVEEIVQGAGLPILTSLTLSMFWEAQLCQFQSLGYLTKLVIESAYDLKFTTLVRILSLLPKLEWVDVARSFIHSDVIEEARGCLSSDPEEPVHLGAIRRMRVSGPVVVLAALLSAVSLPLTAAIHLDWVFPGFTNSENPLESDTEIFNALKTVLDQLGPHFRGLPGAHHRSMLYSSDTLRSQFVLSPHSTLKLRHPTQKMTWECPDHGSVQLVFHPPRELNPTPGQLLLSRMLSSVLPDLEYVAFNDLAPWYRAGDGEFQPWFNAVQNLPKLKYVDLNLRLSTQCMFFNLLDPVAQIVRFGSHDSRPPTFPALEVLVVNHGDLRPRPLAPDAPLAGAAAAAGGTDPPGALGALVPVGQHAPPTLITQTLGLPAAPTPDTNPPEPPPMSRHILDILHSRRELGARLKGVAFRFCLGVNEEFNEKLKSVLIFPQNSGPWRWKSRLATQEKNAATELWNFGNGSPS